MIINFVLLLWKWWHKMVFLHPYNIDAEINATPKISFWVHSHFFWIIDWFIDWLIVFCCSFSRVTGMNHFFFVIVVKHSINKYFDMIDSHFTHRLIFFNCVPLNFSVWFYIHSWINTHTYILIEVLLKNEKNKKTFNKYRSTDTFFNNEFSQ